MHSPELFTCELCGEEFPPEEITNNLYWCCCDDCKEDQEDYNWVIPCDGPWR